MMQHNAYIQDKDSKLMGQTNKEDFCSWQTWLFKIANVYQNLIFSFMAIKGTLNRKGIALYYFIWILATCQS